MCRWRTGSGSQLQFQILADDERISDVGDDAPRNRNPHSLLGALPPDTPRRLYLHAKRVRFLQTLLYIVFAMIAELSQARRVDRQ